MGCLDISEQVVLRFDIPRESHPLRNVREQLQRRVEVNLPRMRPGISTMAKLVSFGPVLVMRNVELLSRLVLCLRGLFLNVSLNIMVSA